MMVRATTLTFSRASASSTCARRPGLFSRNTDTCLVVSMCSPPGKTGSLGHRQGGRTIVILKQRRHTSSKTRRTSPGSYDGGLSERRAHRPIFYLYRRRGKDKLKG